MIERYKLTVTVEPEEERTKNSDSRKKIKLANPRNRTLRMDKVNYVHQVFFNCVYRNQHIYTYWDQSSVITIMRLNILTKIDLKETLKEALRSKRRHRNRH